MKHLYVAFGYVLCFLAKRIGSKRLYNASRHSFRSGRGPNMFRLYWVYMRQSRHSQDIRLVRWLYQVASQHGQRIEEKEPDYNSYYKYEYRWLGLHFVSEGFEDDEGTYLIFLHGYPATMLVSRWIATPD